LIGFSGAGKTTIGEPLARLLDAEFIDLDAYIEQRHGCAIADIFRRDGEATFRASETEAIRELATRHNCIVACGGGTPCHSDNMALMNATGTTVWLRASHERLLSRLSLPEQQAVRPLIAHLSAAQLATYIDAKLAEREPVYSTAHLTFCSDRLEDAQQIADSARALAALLSHAD